jgi:hypothetical protein
MFVHYIAISPGLNVEIARSVQITLIYLPYGFGGHSARFLREYTAVALNFVYDSQWQASLLRPYNYRY